MSADLSTLRSEVRAHLDAWDASGRTVRPYLMNSLWFSLGQGAERRLADAAAHYLGLPTGAASPFGPLPARDADGIKMAVDNCQEAGFDELSSSHLPTTLASWTASRRR